MTWIDRERNTARLVRACWDLTGPRPTAEQLHGLCRLTWITMAAGQVSTDNTRAVVAPALSAVLGEDLAAADRESLVALLRAARAPAAVRNPASKAVGIVNFYGAFRNTSLKWMRRNRAAVGAIFFAARHARSNSSARKAYELMERLPPIPRAGSGGSMQAFNMLTPVVACLDPRERSPVINGREAVRRRLRGLGLAHATLSEQFDGLVGLLNQAGFDGAFALDADRRGDLAKAFARPTRRSLARKKAPRKAALARRSDVAVEVLRQALTETHLRLHNTMTNALHAICKRHGLDVEQGARSNCLFDALVHRYRGTERHLLIEAKTGDQPAFCRLAVGQLLDYRRGLPHRAAIDLAVLFPSAPRRHARDFLADVGVKAIWFSKGRRRLVGDFAL